MPNLIFITEVFCSLNQLGQTELARCCNDMKRSFGTHKIILFGTHIILQSPFILLFNRTYLHNTIAASTFQIRYALQSCHCRIIQLMLWDINQKEQHKHNAISKFLYDYLQMENVSNGWILQIGASKSVA